MANTPFHSGPKIGRNDPCFCGSGVKFKRCHGLIQHTLPALLARKKTENEIIEQGKRYFERHKAQELQRQKQQGLGRPIISIEFQGYRFVAVGSKLHYGKWKTFSDFLANYIKHTLGGEWGNSELAKALSERHLLLQWYDKICHLQANHAKEPGQIFSTPLTGAISAYNRLAYNLYLIAHNDKDIQTRLISRLKNKDNFSGAFYEAQVAAWLIKAGFELEFEDEADGASKHCEFTATYTATGEKYSVEAKSRAIRIGGSSRTPVGRQLGDALEKKADYKRLVFIDLNKSINSKEEADRTFNRAEKIIEDLEKTEINGAPAPNAYVCVTNINDIHALDTTFLTTMISFLGFKIPDFTKAQFPSLREAVRAREKHRPMFQLLKSIEEHRDIPETFGGELPSEAFSENPIPRLQVGEFYLVPGPNGTDVRAKLTQAVVLKDKAYGILCDPKTNNSFMCTFDMTPEELSDYAKYPDTYFGVYHKTNRKADTPMELFDFFFEAYENTPRNRLLELLKARPDQAALQLMSQKDLAEELAEGYACSAMRNNTQANSMNSKVSHKKL